MAAGGRPKVLAEAAPAWGAVEPLTLTEPTRLRMLGALDALMADPGMADVPDSVRLSAVVLAAKTRSASLDVTLTAPELGRWIGLEAQTVRSEVRPRLQRGVAASEDVEAEPAEGAGRGRTLGIRWQVEALRVARHEGGLDDPLRLSKPEFAVWLRLLEAVMAPGWVHADGRVTPPGLLGQRTGGGAATDRLALLLLVLHARPDGSVRLCSGAVQRRYGRAATTVARLLGCKAAGGRAVLERLVVEGVVELPGGWQGRLVVPAVRDAYGRLRAARRAQGRPGGRFSGRSGSDVSVPGDQHALKAWPGVEKPQVTGGQEAAEDGFFGSDVSASLHSDHSPVVAHGADGEGGVCGCSGSAVDGDGGRRECACAREDRPTPGDQAGTGLTAVGGWGPLRGEQPKESPVVEGGSGGRGPVAGASVRVVDGTGPDQQQRGRVPLPSEDLRAVLAPVDLVWARLERPAARRLVEAATRSELDRAAGQAGRADAPQVLADRLARRLAEQLRTGGPIADPVGWLLARGLPQRQGCGDVRCDDRLLLDTGRDCPRCQDRQADRRAERSAVAATVDAAMPGVSEAERRAATEQRLHQDVTARAWAQAHEREQARARQPAAAQARPAAAQARAEAAAAQPESDVPVTPVTPIVLPAPRQECVDCGRPFPGKAAARGQGACSRCREEAAAAVQALVDQWAAQDAQAQRQAEEEAAWLAADLARLDQEQRRQRQAADEAEADRRAAEDAETARLRAEIARQHPELAAVSTSVGGDASDVHGAVTTASDGYHRALAAHQEVGGARPRRSEATALPAARTSVPPPQVEQVRRPRTPRCARQAVHHPQ